MKKWFDFIKNTNITNFNFDVSDFNYDIRINSTVMLYDKENKYTISLYELDQNTRNSVIDNVKKYHEPTSLIFNCLNKYKIDNYLSHIGQDQDNVDELSIKFCLTDTGIDEKKLTNKLKMLLFFITMGYHKTSLKDNYVVYIDEFNNKYQMVLENFVVILIRNGNIIYKIENKNYWL